MKWARSFLIFSIGWFALAGQALLFRQFLVSFEGNELGIGAFFGSWFVWIGIGALLVSRAEKWARSFAAHIEFVSLLYLPAFIAQHFLIAHARQIVGIDPYELFGFGSMVTASLMVNAPVSLMTGMLFPLACQWVETSGDLPVSRVYFWESAGSFLGGLAVTLALWQELIWPVIFFLNAAVLCLAVTSVRITKKRLWTPALVLSGIFIAAIPANLAKRWNNFDADTKWQRLLPTAGYQGMIQTPQGEYLFGTYRETQLLIAGCGQVCETYPNQEAAGRIAALHLAENPQARNVLLVGSDAFSIGRHLLKLKQIENIAVYHSDPKFVLRLKGLITEKNPEFRDSRLNFVSEDIRGYLRQNQNTLDVVILNLPDATTSVLNRFFSVEFYQTIRTALRENGVIGVRISGGENVIGSELADLGASVLSTLRKVFPHVIIEPGEETWLLAGAEEQLTDDTKELVKRFQAIEGADRIFPAQALETLFPKNRVEFARRVYEASDLSTELLINTDDRPLAHLYSLLLLGRQTHSPATRLIKRISLAGIWFFLLPIGVLIVVRIVYVWRLRRYPTNAVSTFSSMFLIFSMGLVSIGTQIVLMYLFQTHYGSLYLFVGLIGSLFMLGLASGAALSRKLLKIPGWSWKYVAVGAVALHGGALMAASQLDAYWNYPLFILAFVICGLLTGIYFPLAARALELANLNARQSGSRLELFDHVGAAMGGFLAGIMILPVLGSHGSFMVLTVLLAANLVFIPLTTRTQMSTSVWDQPAPFFRKAGYFAFALAACVVLVSNLLARLQTQTFPYHQAAALAYGENLEPKNMTLADKQKPFVYYEIANQNQQITAYVYSTSQLAGDVKGYGGPIHLAVRMDPNGILEEYHITYSNETPSYLELLGDWPELLQGKNLFAPHALHDISAVTGATMTCDAIKAILQQSAQQFGRKILGQSIQTEQAKHRMTIIYKFDKPGIFLLVAFFLALLISRLGERWSRRALLLLCLVIGGWWFNLQYSIEQVVTLLSVRLPQAHLTHNFLLVVGIPLLVLTFGNIYCGYLCPFGALQEIIDFILPRKLKRRLTPPRIIMHWSRLAKYLLLLILIGLYFSLGRREVLSADILIAFFSRIWENYKWYILIPTFAGTLVFTRFWCRYLCPAGAFLALLGRWAPLKRLLPNKIYARCDLGVNNARELDCISCDRCRYENTEPTAPLTADTEKPFPKAIAPLLPLSMLILAAIIISVTAQSLAPYIQTESFATPTFTDSAVSVPGAVPSTGEPRKVDEEKIRRMIQQQQLSDHEADFYRQIPKGEKK